MCGSPSQTGKEILLSHWHQCPLVSLLSHVDARFLEHWKLLWEPPDKTPLQWLSNLRGMIEFVFIFLRSGD